MAVDILSGLVTVATVMLAGISLVLLVPALTLLVECVTALRWPSRPGATSAAPSLALLMPAHNEATGISQTLATLVPQLFPHDRLLVVADNCTDDTAAVARQAGATVVERVDPQRRGKGYALDFGLQQLAADPPEVVVLVDADCDVYPGAVAALAQQAQRTQRPCQGIYLMETPAQPSLKDGVSAFAFKVKNQVRPLGLFNLSQPCLLTGTGMAAPWSALTEVNLASGHIVEDMKLGLDLAVAGHAPRFCPAAKVISRLPDSDQAATSQRTRWEHGHLQVVRSLAPTLLGQALRQRRLDLLALALELAVPPLSLLVMLTVALAGINGLWGGITQQWLPTQITLAALAAVGVAIGAAWARHGRSDLSLAQLAAIPLYILGKIPLYFKFLVKPQQDWVRTERSSSKSGR